MGDLWNRDRGCRNEIWNVDKGAPCTASDACTARLISSLRHGVLQPSLLSSLMKPLHDIEPFTFLLPFWGAVKIWDWTEFYGVLNRKQRISSYSRRLNGFGVNEYLSILKTNIFYLHFLRWKYWLRSMALLHSCAHIIKDICSIQSEFCIRIH